MTDHAREIADPRPVAREGDALREVWFENLTGGVRELVSRHANRHNRQHMLAAIDEAARRLAALSSPPTPEGPDLRALAAWIRTPGNINRDDVIDECARLLERNADHFDAALRGGQQ